MFINRVEIKDFLVFKGEFKADFCKGVNVLIGENGVGKTTLMRAMYGKWSWALSPNVHGFVNTGSFAGGFVHFSHMTDDSRLLVYSDGENGDIANLPATFTDYSKTVEVFIPADEMLSLSRGMLALNNERFLPFDETQIDILSKAEIPETRKILPNAAKTLEIIRNIIGGEVVYENDIFYIKKDADGQLIPFSFEASGFKKLGLLWRLLRNGFLEDGAVLFWDEPENSLNPENYSVLVDILLELSRGGVQVFIATHSETFAAYVDVNRKEHDDEVVFYSLYRDEERVKMSLGKRFDLLKHNKLTDEVVNLYKKEIRVEMGR